MSANMNAYRQTEPELINVKRNPYLVDYEEERKAREQRTRTHRVQQAETQQCRMPGERMSGERRHRSVSRASVERKRAAARRRRIVRFQRMTLCAGAFCIVLLSGILFLKQLDADASTMDNGRIAETNIAGQTALSGSEHITQGLSAVEFAKHPEWTEDFLTPNEYSRPGDALTEVKNIFVHYTANPGTSAAQNRSYFEQLKDTHERSASAHFIIGYEGEILQCIPLNEIAYAVQTRNNDSVSIECCYLEADGSFTRETYDSLIKLLTWLTDVYNLDAEDILRHYDCGGKKCPLYYTEHEDAWEKLKEDVALSIDR